MASLITSPSRLKLTRPQTRISWARIFKNLWRLDSTFISLILCFYHFFLINYIYVLKRIILVFTIVTACWYIIYSFLIFSWPVSVIIKYYWQMDNEFYLGRQRQICILLVLKHWKNKDITRIKLTQIISLF
jgi:hypothetical protein